MRCSCLTKKHKPCPIFADRITEGKPYCHVHDPRGAFQQQVAANREDRRKAKEVRRPQQGKALRSALYAQELAALRRSMELD